MKLAVNTYSWLWNKTLEDTVRILGDNGISGVEFLVSPPHFYLADYRPGVYRKLRRTLEEYGMEAVSLNIPSMDINIASPFPEMREMTLGLYRRAALAAQELGAKILVIPPGKRHPLLPPDYDLIASYAKDSLLRLADYLQDTGLTVGLETLPSNFIDTAAQLRQLVREVGSDRVKAVCDTANVIAWEDPASAVLTLREELCLLHLSDTRCGKWVHDVLGSGEVDYTSYLRAAKETGYDGYLVLEMISKDGIGGILRSIEMLRGQGLHL
ncbi:MAG: sugar phosphate isomerase/epimerase family protein [Anaerotruncus rubiinfantis]|jgi:L-ribulose-5-phosphate 3-epimerase|uniref:sugar phosphate isomerase/epimerase family protein n=1 Tax=Anaerotruncus TaxID=244127 RepID=UPI001314DFA0|nr:MULTISPECIES: sugar phosphate isomerase/epimerase family protein [Anaerotruncus]